jgi:hypothetical protein
MHGLGWEMPSCCGVSERSGIAADEEVSVMVKSVDCCGSGGGA